MTENLVSVGEGGLAEAPDYGMARAGQNGRANAGHFGMASAGFGGVARAGAWGVAIADEQGEAEAGDNGVAISDGKRFGSATAGKCGVAVGRGRFKIAEADAAGVAVVMEGGGRATAGRGGIAINQADVACVGRGGVAIGRVVSGHDEALLVAIGWNEVTRTREYASGVVGRENIQRFVNYRCVEGELTAGAEWDEDISL
jgi:hypothetical protein